MHSESDITGGGRSQVTRRDLFRQLFGGVVAGGAVLESGFYRAALARAMAPRPATRSCSTSSRWPTASSLPSSGCGP